ncbi:MAG: TetR/AcrR family transcriptional regulator [Azospirillaceae bacterium]|nr:TetR/AcrR family transcriptional regulator [Azospirillaceae bacterium]
MEPTYTDAGEMRARILNAAETLLRRHGPEKLTVIDVARALNMSHGNVYRYFPSKAALRAAVIERWLNRVAEQTDAIARKDGSADIRLEEWLTGLATIKQHKVIDDAEMLAAAAKVVRESPQVEQGHSARLTAQVVQILQDGREDGTLPGVRDPQSTAIAILNATFRYHHPDLVATGGPPDAQSAALSEVVSLIMGGLKRTAR